MIKKISSLLAIAGLGVWWVNKNYSSEERYFVKTDDYSNNIGGFLRTAFNIASGDFGEMTNSELPNESM